MKPWHWPCIESPDAENPWPEGSHMASKWKLDVEAQERYRQLERAARRNLPSPEGSKHELEQVRAQ